MRLHTGIHPRIFESMAVMTQGRAQFALMHSMILLFGIGAWVAINGVWVELPVLINNPEKSLPEGWGLPAFLVALSQVANIGPLTVALMKGFLPDYYHRNALIYIMLILGSMSSFLLCFLWDKTVYVSGVEHSVAFFVLFLILSFVDCTSSVTFLPFVSRFTDIFVTTYFVGEGLSGFVPSIVALAQGASQSYCVNSSYLNESTNETQYKVETRYSDPRFSVGWFFGFICMMMFCCLISFILLNRTRTAGLFRVSNQSADNENSDTTHSSGHNSRCGTAFYTNGRDAQTCEDETNTSRTPLEKATVPTTSLEKTHYAFFYVVVLWISGISNGVMPSVISYSSLPYGQFPYHLAATLGTMANPVACLFSMFLPAKSAFSVGGFAIVTTACACYLMILAVQSPCPLLVDNDFGALLMVAIQIAFVFTTSYAKVSIGQILRTRGSRNALVWYGAFTQLGSLVGAMIMFPLVNIYYLFVAGDPCVTTC